MSQSQLKKGGGPATKAATKEQNKLNPNLVIRVVSAYIYKDYEVKGKMDPYVKVKLGNLEYQTSTATDQGQHPKWGEDASFGFFHTKEEFLTCELWEDDIDTSDDYLGTVQIAVKDLKNNDQQGEKKYIVMDKEQKIADLVLIIKYDTANQIDPVKNQKQIEEATKKAQDVNEQNKANRKNAQLEKSQNAQNQPQAQNNSKQNYQNLPNQSQVDNKSQLNKPNQSQLANTSQLKQSPNIVVQILSAQILNNFEEEKGKMDPFFVMKMGNQNFKTTTAVDQGQNPKWTEGAKHGFVRTTEDRIIIELWEDDDNSTDDYLGTAQIDINELLANKPPQNQYSIFDKNGQKIGDVQLLIQIDVNSMEKNNNKMSQNSLGQSKQYNIAQVQSLGIQKLDASRSISKEELAQKTKEIQDRLSNIQVKLRPQPLVTYIEDNVHKALLDGMKKLAKERPTNPIRELGMFLINYSETSQSQKQ